MDWLSLSRAIVSVPWAEVTRLGVTVLLCLVTWALTKRWYAKEWMRFAPEKAKDEVKGAQLEMRRAVVRIAALQRECSRLRGQIRAAQGCLGDVVTVGVVERKE